MDFNVTEINNKEKALKQMIDKNIGKDMVLSIGDGKQLAEAIKSTGLMSLIEAKLAAMRYTEEIERLAEAVRKVENEDYKEKLRIAIENQDISVLSKEHYQKPNTGFKLGSYKYKSK